MASISSKKYQMLLKVVLLLTKFILTQFVRPGE